MTRRRTPENNERTVEQPVILPSGQRATISLRYEVPDPREALEPNGPFARIGVRAGASHGEVQGPAADLKESLAAMLKLLQEHC